MSKPKKSKNIKIWRIHGMEACADAADKAMVHAMALVAASEGQEYRSEFVSEVLAEALLQTLELPRRSLAFQKRNTWKP